MASLYCGFIWVCRNRLFIFVRSFSTDRHRDKDILTLICYNLP